MPTTVLLTGANGFLGAHLARELLRRHYVVRALLRPASDRRTLAGLPINVVEGNVVDADSVVRAAQGCDAIIHAAALAQVNPARDPAIWAVNQAGTQHVVAAALRANVERLVFVGTANVFGFGPLAQPGNETRPFAGAHYGLDYMDSKVAATHYVTQAARQRGLPAVLVHPTFMLGPLDARPTSGALLLELYRGGLIGYPAGGKNYVHVADVATATVNALTMGRVGESYILGHQNWTYREAFGRMAAVLGTQPPRWAIGPALARLYGHGCDWVARLSGRPMRLNAAMTAVANDGHYFSAQKAIDELNLPQTPVEQAIQEAFDWFRANDYVR